jgi:acetyl esterase/lipase
MRAVTDRWASSFGVVEQTGRVFATHGDEQLLADIYRPDGAGPFPALVLLHGGAFTKGSRISYQEWGRYFAARGIVAFAADYRLATARRPTFPEAIWDAKAAMQFVRGSAAELTVDPDRIGIVGGSAGAYLAAMVTLTCGEPSFANPSGGPFADVDSRPSITVAMAGTYDLLDHWMHDRTHRPPDQQAVEAFIGGTPMDSRLRYFEASPTFHASEANARGTRWLIGWGTEDEVADPQRHSVALAEQLGLAGGLVRQVPLTGAPHFWYMEASPEDELSYSGQFARRLLGFLDTWTQW